MSKNEKRQTNFETWIRLFLIRINFERNSSTILEIWHKFQKIYRILRHISKYSLLHFQTLSFNRRINEIQRFYSLRLSDIHSVFKDISRTLLEHPQTTPKRSKISHQSIRRMSILWHHVFTVEKTKSKYFIYQDSHTYTQYLETSRETCRNMHKQFQTSPKSHVNLFAVFPFSNATFLLKNQWNPKTLFTKPPMSTLNT